MASDLARKYPDTNRNFGVAVHRLSDLTPRDVRLALLFQLAAVALLAIVTCANVANLQIAHAAARSSEVSIRITLGASRRRPMRQLWPSRPREAAGGRRRGFLALHLGL